MEQIDEIRAQVDAARLPPSVVRRFAVLEVLRLAIVANDAGHQISGSAAKRQSRPSESFGSLPEHGCIDGSHRGLTRFKSKSQDFGSS